MLASGIVILSALSSAVAAAAFPPVVAHKEEPGWGHGWGPSPDHPPGAPRPGILPGPPPGVPAPPPPLPGAPRAPPPLPGVVPLPDIPATCRSLAADLVAHAPTIPPPLFTFEASWVLTATPCQAMIPPPTLSAAWSSWTSEIGAWVAAHSAEYSRFISQCEPWAAAGPPAGAPCAGPVRTGGGGGGGGPPPPVATGASWTPTATGSVVAVTPAPEPTAVVPPSGTTPAPAPVSSTVQPAAAGREWSRGLVAQALAAFVFASVVSMW